MSVQSYPLHWPPGFPRSKYREHSRFKTSFDQALKNVQGSLRKFAADSGRKLEHAIMSSNRTLTGEAPLDPGVAVWFVWDGMQLCIAVDRYNVMAANLQAIHHIIEARRVELRHGTLHLVKATFQGFQALPSPSGKHWSDILQVARNATRETIEANYRRLAKDRHPDAGGAAEAMAELNNARDTALREAGS